MGSKVPSQPIAAALFGAARQGVLRLLFGHADERFYQRQIVREIGLGYGAVQRELKRLERCGLLLRSVEGRQTYYQANADSPVFEELRGLIRKTFGVADVLRGGLARLAKDVRVAFLYGSVAKGDETAESDVDLLLVADSLGLTDIVAALRRAQEQLRRDVNPTVYQTKEFCRKLAQGHHFVTRVVAGPKIFVVGDESELARLGEIGLGQAASNNARGNRGVVRARRS
jgi:predicted nucleotidyltransferase